MPASGGTKCAQPGVEDDLFMCKGGCRWKLAIWSACTLDNPDAARAREPGTARSVRRSRHCHLCDLPGCPTHPMPQDRKGSGSRNPGVHYDSRFPAATTHMRTFVLRARAAPTDRDRKSTRLNYST